MKHLPVPGFHLLGFVTLVVTGTPMRLGIPLGGEDEGDEGEDGDEAAAAAAAASASAIRFVFLATLLYLGRPPVLFLAVCLVRAIEEEEEE